ncbi:unnamed protein product [Clonostachys rosea f. rosea IK726]|uniref:Uncharacterized protein n=1 Tax=Clonostachys rosea f. rosea IK726 TaxID=1349383 RepID=A0ACA9UB51_BIOOC|nr:unnamed protein product [Clonostachys rosea f. rosea IK726]
MVFGNPSDNQGVLDRYSPIPAGSSHSTNAHNNRHEEVHVVVVKQIPPVLYHARRLLVSEAGLAMLVLGAVLVDCLVLILILDCHGLSLLGGLGTCFLGDGFPSGRSRQMTPRSRD